MLSKFPTYNYRFPKNEYRRIVNFTISILIERMNISNKLLFKPVTITEEETPETVSERIYDTPDFWWVILLTNDVINPFNQWHRPNDLIHKQTKHDNPIILFMDINTNRIVDDVDHQRYLELRQQNQPLPEHINAYTKYQYETYLNAPRNNIWVISPDYIYKFVDEFEDLLQITR